MNTAAKAGFWMLDYAYDAVDEFRGLFRTDAVLASTALAPPPTRTTSRRPVVLLPGVFEKWHALYAVAGELRRAGHPVFALPQLGRNVAPINETAREVADFLETHDLHDVVLVAHSKGGLIGKYLMMRYDPQMRVAGLVAVNTPFSGSVWGRYLKVPSVRMFAPTDLTITFLGGDAPVNSRIVSIFGTFDQHVPAGSALPGAKNIRLPVAGHSRILSTRPLVVAVAGAVEGLPAQAGPESRARPTHSPASPASPASPTSARER